MSNKDYMLNTLFSSTHTFCFAPPGPRYLRSRPPRRGIAAISSVGTSSLSFSYFPSFPGYKLKYLVALLALYEFSIRRGTHLISLNCCVFNLCMLEVMIIFVLVCRYCNLGIIPIIGNFCLNFSRNHIYLSLYTRALEHFSNVCPTSSRCRMKSGSCHYTPHIIH